jgi:hypothetical protein
VRLSLSGMLRSLRGRREHRLLTQAMRETPPPRPPDGLRERLLEQALAASRTASPRRAYPRWIWAVPAAAMTAAMVWIAWTGMTPAPHVQGKPGTPIAQAHPVPHKDVRIAERKEDEHRTGMAPRASTRRTVRTRRTKPSPRYVASVPVARQPAVEQAPAMRVVVSNTREGDGYAEAAACSTDANGRRSGCNGRSLMIPIRRHQDRNCQSHTHQAAGSR